MNKFELLTKYSEQLDKDDLGQWNIDRENDGTPEHPMQIPYANYPDIVDAFVDDAYHFVDENEDFELNRYGDILDEHGIEWNRQSMSRAEVDSLDGQCVMALIIGAVRAERFCEGILLEFFRDGSILRWLKRLEEIDNR